MPEIEPAFNSRARALCRSFLAVSNRPFRPLKYYSQEGIVYPTEQASNYSRGSLQLIKRVASVMEIPRLKKGRSK
jgi:hypothetical protein